MRECSPTTYLRQPELDTVRGERWACPGPARQESPQALQTSGTRGRLGRRSTREADGRHDLVSIDDHLIEPPDMFENHVPANWRDAVPRVVRNESGVRRVGAPGAAGPRRRSAWPPPSDGRSRSGASTRARSDELPVKRNIIRCGDLDGGPSGGSETGSSRSRGGRRVAPCSYRPCPLADPGECSHCGR